MQPLRGDRRHIKSSRAEELQTHAGRIADILSDAKVDWNGEIEGLRGPA
jgi:hypothetical protein